MGANLSPTRPAACGLVFPSSPSPPPSSPSKALESGGSVMWQFDTGFSRVGPWRGLGFWIGDVLEAADRAVLGLKNILPKSYLKTQTLQVKQ